MVGLPTGPFDNAKAIYQGLLAMGLSTDAAAGVAGNIYQESHGNPHSSSSAGGGLFGETIQNQGRVGGGSLQEQLAALKAYIAKNGSIADINHHASSPRAAALYFSARYERPGIPNNPVREQAAAWVAEAAKTGHWGSSKGTAGSSGGGGGSGGGGQDTGLSWLPTLVNPLAPFLGGFNALKETGGAVSDVARSIGSFTSEVQTLFNWVSWLFQPKNWVRIISGWFGVFFLILGVVMLATAAK